MSEQGVERVRRGIDAFNRGDVEEVISDLDPEIVWHVPPVLPEQSVYRGHQG
jgi:ketosteroid isomerase-like protein